MMHGISRNKRRSPHACRSAVGIFHLREQWHRSGAIRGQPAQDRALRHLRQVVEDLRRLAVPDHLGRSASLDDLAVLAQNLEDRP